MKNYFSYVFFKIGNAFNIFNHTLDNPYKLKYSYKYDDEDALKSDWEAIGQDMKKALKSIEELNEDKRIKKPYSIYIKEKALHIYYSGGGLVKDKEVKDILEELEKHPCYFRAGSSNNGLTIIEKIY